jgi:hypothetical protein
VVCGLGLVGEGPRSRYPDPKLPEGRLARLGEGRPPAHKKAMVTRIPGRAQRASKQPRGYYAAKTLDHRTEATTCEASLDATASHLPDFAVHSCPAYVTRATPPSAARDTIQCAYAQPSAPEAAATRTAPP